MLRLFNANDLPDLVKIESSTQLAPWNLQYFLVEHALFLNFVRALVDSKLQDLLIHVVLPSIDRVFDQRQRYLRISSSRLFKSLMRICTDVTSITFNAPVLF